MKAQVNYSEIKKACHNYIDCYHYLYHGAGKYSAQEILEAEDDLKCAIDELRKALK